MASKTTTGEQDPSPGAFEQQATAAWATLLPLLPALEGAKPGAVSFVGDGPALDTPHRLAAGAAAAIAAVGMGAAQRWHAHTGQSQSIRIDGVQAVCALEPSHFQQQQGYPLPQSSHSRELKSGFYATADGKWFLPSGSYPHLRDATLALLDCANTQSAIAAAVARHTGDQLEQRCAELGIPGVYARSRAQWLAHEQGAALQAVPVIDIERIGDSAPEPARCLARPLDDLRVLDLSHVVAGPVAARTLGALGADVLRVSAPHQPDPIAQILDTGIGKRNTYLDLRRQPDQATLHRLARQADVVVQSWRPGALDALGACSARLADHRPGLIYVSISAFGHVGPWQNRKGFDQMGQAATGLAVAQNPHGRPALVPTRLVNDYLTAYLAAAGVLQALARRARDGGSYHVRLSLARTAMWLQQLGPSHARAPFVAYDALQPVMEQRDSPFGRLTQLGPVATLSATPLYWHLPPAPLGSHDPAWRDRPTGTPAS